MKKNGFTLIELIIVLTIAFILISGATISYNRFNEEKKLNQEAAKLVDTLKLAQIKSRTGERGNCLDLVGYETQIRSSQYLVNICCSSTCSPTISTNTFPQNIIADSGYALGVAYRMHAVNVSSGLTEVFQLASDGSLGSALPIDTTKIKIKHTALGQCIDIKMTAVGSVTMTGRYTNGC